MNVLVSQVGEQPGAVATAAMTLRKQRQVNKVVLLCTSHTTEAATSLRTFLRGQNFDVPKPVSIDPIRDDELVAEILLQSAKNNGTAFFNVSGGLSFFVAKVARRVSGKRGVCAVYAGFDRLYRVGERESNPWQLEDIGIEGLLGMHGLRANSAKSEPTGVFRDFTVSDGSGVILRADQAYERAGRLFCLLRDRKGLDAAREIISWMRGAPAFHKLRPVFLIETDDNNMARRLRFVGAQVIERPRRSARGSQAKAPACDAAIAAWQSRQPQPPGQTLPLPCRSKLRTHIKPVKGADGKGDPVLLCLGNDPSATLRALNCHRPRKAWILFDWTTPYVSLLAQRLAENAGQLPVGDLCFMGVTHWAFGINKKIIQGLVGSEAGVWANVTPGSKAQSWALGTLGEDVVRLCSLDAARQRVAVLSDTVPGTTWQDADLLVTARMRGGPLREPGHRNDADSEERRDFLDTVTKVVARQAKNNQHGRFAFGNTEGSCSDEKTRTCWSQEDSPDGKGRVLKIKVQPRDRNGATRTVRGEFFLPFDKEHRPKVGKPLEEVVGRAFGVAGATDVHVGMTWNWSASDSGLDHHRTEIDVVFQWRGRHPVGVSVKHKVLENDKTRVRTEILGMVQECFGRFCLPVLIYGIPKNLANKENAAKALEENGVIEIGICRLDDPDFLSRVLDAAFSALQTMRLQKDGD